MTPRTIMILSIPIVLYYTESGALMPYISILDERPDIGYTGTDYK